MGRSSAVRRSALADWATWGISVVNGFWGDYLQQQGNGLAVAMAMYHHGRPLELTGDRLALAHPQPTAKLCILVHGLSCSERSWAFALPAPGSSAGSPAPEPAVTRQVDYGSLLQAAKGYTPFYLRYNSGLSVAENGRLLAELLDALLAAYPLPVQEIIFIGHSMGGLVVRSACHAAAAEQRPWAQQVMHIFYLGTPHEGADLARAAHHVTGALRIVPNPITRLVADVLDLRSQGIKDLRQGVDAPWLAGAEHYLIGGAWHGDPLHLASVFLGDGLVRHPDPARAAMQAENIRLFPGVRHMQLAHDEAVYRQLLAWLGEE